MLTMPEICKIRQSYYQEGNCLSEISRKFRVDRKTVRKYLKKNGLEDSCEKGAEHKARAVKIDPYTTEIDEWLENDKLARVKQRHTAQRVYDRLKEKYQDGFDCSYRTVAVYFKKKKKEVFKTNDCALPLVHIAGEAQVDFGEADFYENGKLVNGAYINMSFPYSNAGYTQLFRGENRECWLEGMKAIFEHIGGVPSRIWFDNTKAIVNKILRHEHRELCNEFLLFKDYYGFEAVFCNPDSGNEKGSVENKVGYHRRNLLVPVPTVAGLQEFNCQLFQQCDELLARKHYMREASISELFESDRKKFYHLPAKAYEVCRYEIVKTNAYGKFTLQNGLHSYSTAPKYASCSVAVRISANEVVPCDADYLEIVRHQRLYGNFKQERMEWLPYLLQISRKPGALKYTGIYAMFPQPLREYLDNHDKGERGKVLKTIAGLCQEYGFCQAVAAAGAALECNVCDIDSLLAITASIAETVPQLKLEKLPENTPQLPAVTVDTTEYDRALAH